MPKQNLYDLHVAGAKTDAAFQQSLRDVSDIQTEGEYKKKTAEWQQQDFGDKISAIGDTLELASTLYGGWQDKKKFENRLKKVGDKHGKLEEDKRSLGKKAWDYLSGAEKTYTFTNPETGISKEFSKGGVSAEGGVLMGEGLSGSADVPGVTKTMGDEVDISDVQEKNYDKKKDEIKEVNENKDKPPKKKQSKKDYMSGKGLSMASNTALKKHKDYGAKEYAQKPGETNEQWRERRITAYERLFKDEIE
tara:strand:+ start:29 stop:775 length:747 start_codon:yes stop_codon:yes gene_type:complete